MSRSRSICHQTTSKTYRRRSAPSCVANICSSEGTATAEANCMSAAFKRRRTCSAVMNPTPCVKKLFPFSFAACCIKKKSKNWRIKRSKSSERLKEEETRSQPIGNLYKSANSPVVGRNLLLPLLLRFFLFFSSRHCFKAGTNE